MSARIRPNPVAGAGSAPAAPTETSSPRLVRSQAVAAEPRPPRRGNRLFDIASALLLGLVFSPVIAAACLALARSDGPVLFRQTRVGRGGRPFTCYKFRTMVPNAQAALADLLARDPAAKAEWERDFKLKRDPRVTPIGRFLRKTSLDELPQLWNVLRGDMGLVGPRPVEPFEIQKYGRHAKHYYAQKPGLTGLWQVSGRSNTSYERRVLLDAYYSRNRSLRMDLGIVLKTVRVVLFGSGAY